MSCSALTAVKPFELSHERSLSSCEGVTIYSEGNLSHTLWYISTGSGTGFSTFFDAAFENTEPAVKISRKQSNTGRTAEKIFRRKLPREKHLYTVITSRHDMQRNA